MGIVEDTQKVLNEAREKSESIIVSFSGGKDSSATALLCMRTFKVVKFDPLGERWSAESCDMQGRVGHTWCSGLVVHRNPHLKGCLGGQPMKSQG